MNSVETSNHVLRLFSPSGSQTILVFVCQTVWRYSDGDHLNGDVECRWGRHKSRFSTSIRPSINDGCSANNKCDRPPYSLPHTSVNLCVSQPAAWTTTTKRTKQNLFVYAAVNLKRKQLMTEDCDRRIVLFKPTTDRREASRGLSATAGLLACFLSVIRVI